MRCRGAAAAAEMTFLVDGFRGFRENYVYSGLLWVFVVFTIFFAAWQTLLWALVVYVLSEEISAVASLFEGLSFIVGFIFFSWLSAFRGGYLGGPQSLSTLTQDVVRLCQQLAALLQPFERNLAPAQARLAEAHVTRFVRVSQTLLADLYALRVAECEWRVRGERHPGDTLTTPWCRDEYWPALQEPWEGSSAERLDRLCTVLTGELKLLETDNYLSGADFRLLYTHLERVVQSLDSMVAGSHLRAPPYIDNHSSVVIGMWFLVITPLTLAHRSGYYAIIVYPFLMALFFGYAILSTWLRSAFARQRPWRGMDFRAWRDQAVARLDVVLENFVALGAKAERRAELRDIRDSLRTPPPPPGPITPTRGTGTVLDVFAVPPPPASETATATDTTAISDDMQVRLLEHQLATPASGEHRRQRHRDRERRHRPVHPNGR